jgi:hypothetical protein
VPRRLLLLLGLLLKMRLPLLPLPQLLLPPPLLLWHGLQEKAVVLLELVETQARPS